MDLDRAGVRDVEQLLTHAATAMNVVRLDTMTYANDVSVLREVAPEVPFERGDRPVEPGVVYVAAADDRVVLLAARTRAGRWSSPGSPDTRGVVMHIMPLERRGLSWRR
jgi:hypothetical protein